MTDVQRMPVVQEDDEAERAWRLQQQQHQDAGDDSNGSPVEPVEGDDDDDEEAERAWQLMQQRFQEENEEAQKLEEIRQKNELASSNATDDDDGIYKGDLTIPFENLVFEKEPVGGGNFGKIFKGDYLGAEVAIKKFAFEDDAKYVEREVSVLKAIRHPNIVTFIGACQHSSGLYVVTELVPKGDLAHELYRNTKISWRQKLLWTKDVCAATAYLHELGIIHRDIKPDNLLVTDNMRLKLCDLGFARTAKRSRQRMSIAGTGQYMAPEVMTGDKYDAKVDVFSFGAVLLEFITRRPPPKRLVSNNYFFDFGQLRSLVPADCPSDLLDICFDCLLPNPDERPSMKELLPRITQILNSLPLDVSDDTMSEEQRKMEEEAERAFLQEAEKSLKENQAFLEAVKEIEAEQALALAGAKEDMEKKLKAAIEKEVEERLREEKRRLREEMKKELESTKAQLTASYSSGSLTDMMVHKQPRRNSLDLEQVREVRKDLEKESKKLKKEEKELKGLRKEEEKKKKRELLQKKRQEEVAKARQSWGPSSRKRNQKELEHTEMEGARAGRSLSNDAQTMPGGQVVIPSKSKKKRQIKKEKHAKEKEAKKEEKEEEKKKKELAKKEKKAREKKEKQAKEKEAKKDDKKGTKKSKFGRLGKKPVEKKTTEPRKEDGKADEKVRLQLTTSGDLYG